MGWLTPWRGRSNLRDGGFWSGLFGRAGNSGEVVTVDSTLQLAAAFACIRLVAQVVACMPLAFHRKGAGDGREVVSDYALAEVLTVSPNDEQTTVEFWEGMVAWLCANGNAYAEISTSGDRITALQQVPSDEMRPYRDTDSGDLRYLFVDRGKPYDLPQNKVFHLRGFGFGGDLGLSPISFGANSLGSAIAADKTAAGMFGNGLNLSGVLTSDQLLKQPQREQLAEVMKQYVGSKNAGKMMILEAGLKYQQLTLNPEDAQLLETRRFGVEEICRWFGIPPMLIGHSSEGQTMWGSGVEQILIAWLVLGLNPYLTRIEKRILKQLVPRADRLTIYPEYNREGLLQADSAAKAAFLSTLAQNGFISRNEGRKKLNMPRQDGADGLTVQSNLVPIDQLGNAPAATRAADAIRSWLASDQKETRHAA